MFPGLAVGLQPERVGQGDDDQVVLLVQGDQLAAVAPSEVEEVTARAARPPLIAVAEIPEVPRDAVVPVLGPSAEARGGMPLCGAVRSSP